MIDYEKMKRIIGPGCIYVENDFYVLVITDEHGNKLNLKEIYTILGKKALEDCTTDKKSTIGTTIRQLGMNANKHIGAMSRLDNRDLSNFEEVVSKMVMSTPNWEVSVMGFVLGYLMSNFVRKNNIKLSLELLDFSLEEKEIALRLSKATIFTEILINRGIEQTYAWAMALGHNLLEESDLPIICEPEVAQKILKTYNSEDVQLLLKTYPITENQN